MPLQGYDTNSVVAFDQHLGKALCYITINRNVYWWNRITVNTSIDLRENTDPCSPVKQYQIIRETPLTVDIDMMLPGPTNAAAANYLADFRPGIVVSYFNCSLIHDILTPATAFNADTARGNVQADGSTGTVAYAASGTSAYGAFVIENASVDISRDDFTTTRLTLRALGYGTNTTIADSPGDGGPDDWATNFSGETYVDPNYPTG